jgi:hypothetical protein
MARGVRRRCGPSTSVSLLTLFRHQPAFFRHPDFRQIPINTYIPGRGEELAFDANRSWTPAEAITALNTTREILRVVEQPCETYGQHLAVRAALGQPLAIFEADR